MPILIEGGIQIGEGVLIANGSIPTPTTPTHAYWAFDPNNIGQNLGLYNTSITNGGVEAQSPEQSMVLGKLENNESMHDMGSGGRIMFTIYHQTEDTGDIPLDLAAVGVANYSADLSAALGIDANSIGYFQHGELVYSNAQIATGLPTFVPGDYIDFAIKILSGGGVHVWVRVNGGNWNGNPSADPAADTNYIYAGLDGEGAAGDPNAIYPAASPGAYNYIDAMEISQVTYNIPSGFYAL